MEVEVGDAILNELVDEGGIDLHIDSLLIKCLESIIYVFIMIMIIGVASATRNLLMIGHLLHRYSPWQRRMHIGRLGFLCLRLPLLTLNRRRGGILLRLFLRWSNIEHFFSPRSDPNPLCPFFLRYTCLPWYFELDPPAEKIRVVRE